MADQPTGTLTLLFTDIQGSTRLLQSAPEIYPQVLARHHALLRSAIAAGSGTEVKTEGDSFFVVFRSAADAISTAVTAQLALHAANWPGGLDVRVRMGLHTGEVALMGGEYVGLDVHRAARIAASAHGGQVVLSEATGGMSAGRLPAGVSLRSLGEHRLRDIEVPERLSQLVIDGLPSDFPPIRSMTARFEILPTERTGFIGREEQVAEALDLLGRTRLLTLTGPGGTGKTRLAQAVARRAQDRFADGVAFVELAPITDARLVASTVRQTLAVPEQAASPAISTLVSTLADRELLLVLDNFEQVLEAAGDVDRLLSGTSRLTILITSRAVLHVTGEQEYPVPPLEIPSPNDAANLDVVAQSECVQLFVQRARAADPAFHVSPANAPSIVDICRQLDGLPLAIELAASRVKLLSPQMLLARLSNRLDVLQSSSADRTDRQRTLRGAIDWSYGLLSEDERAGFRRMAVFVGGWSMEAAETVIRSAGPIAAETLDLLQRLVDHSLVRMAYDAEEPRFLLLETLREYGLDRLGAAGEMQETARAHAELFLSMAHTLGAEFTRGEKALNAAELEHDNIRSALRWAIDARAIEEALEAVGVLWRFWHLRGHLAEGERWASEALGLRSSEPSHGRTRALNARAGLVYWMGDYAGARSAYLEMLDGARASGDRLSEMEALYSLGFVHGIDRNFDAARTAFGESRDIARVLGDRLGEASGSMGIAFTDWLDGRFAEARDGLEETVPVLKNLGDRFTYLNAVGVLGRALQSVGDLPRARERALEQLDGAIELGDQTMTAMSLHDLASLAAQATQFERGLQLEGASGALVDRLGGGAPPALVGLERPDELAAAAGMSEADIRAAIAQGGTLPLEEAIALARASGQPSG